MQDSSVLSQVMTAVRLYCYGRNVCSIVGCSCHFRVCCSSTSLSTKHKLDIRIHAEAQRTLESYCSTVACPLDPSKCTPSSQQCRNPREQDNPTILAAISPVFAILHPSVARHQRNA